MRLPKKWWARILLILVGLFLIIQVVPYGRSHTNPAVGKAPAWDGPRTLALAKRACFDCHSNETTWPWYSHVAPVSWLVQDHVDEGREHLNFSEFGKHQDDAYEAAEEVAEGEMPPWDYLLTHPEARLSDVEKRELIAGLKATFGGDEHPDEDDD